jgi:dihydrofolate reductase
MKRICYAVAMSLDGYIAGPNGEADWIPMDPDMDFAELWSRFDILLMGRKTYEMARTGFERFGTQGSEIVVVSRTLRREDAPNVTIISQLTLDAVASLRVQAKKDIWLFGGGELFRSLLTIGAVDSVEAAVIPVLLGDGLPLLPG